MKNYWIIFIVGIALFLCGLFLNLRYEEYSLTVTATITDIETVDDTDDGPISYRHTYYGTYTVDGKTYTDKKLDTRYNSSHVPDLQIGDTIDVVVSPENPGRQLPEGGVFGVVGLVMTVFAGVMLVRSKKKAKQNAA